MAWRLLEHTADVGIEATGPDPAACLVDAGLALTHVLTGSDAGTFQPDRREHLRIEAPDMPSLAVAFLAELVWLRDGRDLLWAGGELRVEPAGEVWRAEGTMHAVKHHAATHGRGVEVKAVTYHRLEFAPHGDGWRLQVYLDL